MADTLYFNVKFHDALPGNAGADIEISIPQAVMASLAAPSLTLSKKSWASLS